MNRFIISALLSIGLAFCVAAQTRSIDVHRNDSTGALSEIVIQGDTTRMNWILTTDGTQYPWITDRYGWGLGYFTLGSGPQAKSYSWNQPTALSADGVSAAYRTGGVKITVDRLLSDGNLTETYTFTSDTTATIDLSNIGIYAPINDNYPNSATCIDSRAHAHIWAGGNAAYINATRMGSYPPHLGLILTRGAVDAYEIWERSREKESSMTRGIIALCPPNLSLSPGQSYTIQWVVLPHEGTADFQSKLLSLNSALLQCDKYTFSRGETAQISFRTAASATPRLSLNGSALELRPAPEPGLWTATATFDHPGEAIIEAEYADGRRTYAECMVFSDIDSLIERRIDFILSHQRMTDPSDPRVDALMIFDNEADTIYKNDTPNCSPADRDEGAERTGMGLLLAKQYILTADSTLLEPLMKYADYIRYRLQTPDYQTFSDVTRRGRDRAYNYMWIADFYFLMYQATGQARYAIDGYRTLRSMYTRFGHGFYAIGIPVVNSLKALNELGMKAEADTLMTDFRLTGDRFIENGLNYPIHEVNYEQSIVAPSLQFLLQLYIAGGDERYLDEARRQLPVLEAFAGQQPSYHLCDIGIRHWDEYWFGKREMFGDTFPHYWSTITAAVFALYADVSGDESYRSRASGIVRNNLCLFEENGRAHCAYLYPRRVDGQKGQFYDPYANDQDWALVYYLYAEKGI